MRSLHSTMAVIVLVEWQACTELKPLEIMCEKGYALSPALLHRGYGWKWEAEFSGSWVLVLPVLMLSTFRTPRTVLAVAQWKVSEVSTATAVVQALFTDPPGKGRACYPVRNRSTEVGRSAKRRLKWFTETRSRICFPFIFLLIGMKAAPPSKCPVAFPIYALQPIPQNWFLP